MQELKIRIIINSTHQVLDRSSKLPFCIVFGLVRHAPDDQDSRALLFNTAQSILDVPYALSHGLLTISAFGGTEVELGQLSHGGTQKGSAGSQIRLSSPVGRTGHWKDSMTIFHYEVDPNSALGAIFQLGKNYTIRGKAGGDLGGHNHKYADEGEGLEEQGHESPSYQSLKLFSSKVDGRASFTPVPSLAWPPKIETRIQLHQGSEGSNRKDGSILLKITVTSDSTEAVTIQTSGRQYFLVPRGPMGPGPMGSEGEIDDPRPRIIDAKTPSPASSIKVWDMANDTIVREKSRPPICAVYDPAKYDPRPKLESLVTLKPGEPLVRLVDISRVLVNLPDGKYGLQLEPRGLWWCAGSLDDFATEDDRVPKYLFQKQIPPAIIACESMVEVSIENGQLNDIE